MQSRKYKFKGFLYSALRDICRILKDNIIVFPIHPRTKKMFGNIWAFAGSSNCSNVKMLLPEDTEIL